MSSEDNNNNNNNNNNNDIIMNIHISRKILELGTSVPFPILSGSQWSRFYTKTRLLDSEGGGGVVIGLGFNSLS